MMKDGSSMFILFPMWKNVEKRVDTCVCVCVCAAWCLTKGAAFQAVTFLATKDVWLQ